MSKYLRGVEHFVAVKMVGGLGNQLFCYFAGLFLSQTTNTKLYLDLTDIRSGRSKHKVSIESFYLDAYVYSDEVNLFNRLQQLTQRLIRIFRIRFINREFHFISQEVGYDSRVKSLKPPVYLEGYFQTYRYFSQITPPASILRLREPSNWFLDLEAAVKNRPFISIHVRRGDYRQHNSTYGLLSREYYASCLSHPEVTATKLPIYVFSDEIQEAKKVLRGLVPKSTIWINANQTPDPAEELVLMSLASINIIANSTFSWWAASLGQKSKKVFAPKKWFRAMDDPIDIYPPHWNLIESQWEN